MFPVLPEALMEADVDVTDVESEDGHITVFAPHTEYFKAKTAITEALDVKEFEVDEIQFIPQETSPIEGDDIESLEKLIDMLSDLEDVQNVYHSAEY